MHLELQNQHELYPLYLVQTIHIIKPHFTVKSQWNSFRWEEHPPTPVYTPPPPFSGVHIVPREHPPLTN